MGEICGAQGTTYMNPHFPSETMLGHSGSKDPTRTQLTPEPARTLSKGDCGHTSCPMDSCEAAVGGVVVRAWIDTLLMVWDGAGVVGRDCVPITPSSGTDVQGVCDF